MENDSISRTRRETRCRKVLLEALDVIGFPGVLRDGFVSLRWNHIGEGLAVLATEKAFLLARVHTNVAFTGLPSGRTRQIRTKCQCGVHDHPPGRNLQMARKDDRWTCVFFSTNPQHGLVRSYPVKRVRRKPRILQGFFRGADL